MIKKTGAIRQSWAVVTAFMAIFSFIMLSCNNGSTGRTTPTPKPQVTAKITVPAITAVANPMDFGAVSAYTGWDTNFPAADVTYTLSVDGGTPVSSTVSTTVAAAGLSNGVRTITQTFYYKGNPIPNGSRSANIAVTSNTFGALISNFDALSLSLSKDSL